MQRLYEGMFLLEAGRANASWEESLNHVKNLLDRASATLVAAKKWDERKLAYEVDGHKRGVYMLAFFRADSAKIVGLERDCQLSDMILRTLILRRDKLTDEQAIATKTLQEMKEEEARKERERADAARARSDAELALAAAEGGAATAAAVAEPVDR